MTPLAGIDYFSRTSTTDRPRDRLGRFCAPAAGAQVSVACDRRLRACAVRLRVPAGATLPAAAQAQIAALIAHSSARGAYSLGADGASVGGLSVLEALVLARELRAIAAGRASALVARIAASAHRCAP